MPDMTGILLCQKLNEMGVTTPRIMVTGTPSERDEVESHRKLYNMVLHKPVSLALLRRTIRELGLTTPHKL